jgi:hypothetical protein
MDPIMRLMKEYQVSRHKYQDLISRMENEYIFKFAYNLKLKYYAQLQRINSMEQISGSLTGNL